MAVKRFKFAQFHHPRTPMDCICPIFSESGAKFMSVKYFLWSKNAKMWFLKIGLVGYVFRRFDQFSCQEVVRLTKTNTYSGFHHPSVGFGPKNGVKIKILAIFHHFWGNIAVSRIFGRLTFLKILGHVYHSSDPS